MSTCIKEIKYQLDSNYLRVVDSQTGEVVFCGYFEASNYIELTTCCQNMWLYKLILTIHPRIYTVEDVGPKLVLEVFLKDEDIEQK